MSDPRLDGDGAGAARSRARKLAGVARVRATAQGRADQVVAGALRRPDGIVRQHDRYKTKGDALAHMTARVAELNRNGRDMTAVPTLTELLDQWPDTWISGPTGSAASADPADQHRADHALHPACAPR